ncbi:MAG: alpha-amylase family glycosyl hydrolase [Flavobacteriales bacterium]
MNRILPILSAGLLLASCNAGGGASSRADELVHPEWSRNAVIYEMNVRQHSPDGTLSSARADLARLHQLGIDIVWLMPVHPIGEVNRKGGENKDNYLVQPGSSSLGSPYSVQDYKALNPDYGTWEDFDAFVATAHDYEMKVIIDWVANHTAFDAVWTTDSIGMGYYLLDSLGGLQPPTGTDWVDVAQLDWDNGEANGLYDAMEDAMAFWVRDHDIDGFRCDVAEKVPTAFWDRARKALEDIKPDVFMLAEAEVPEHHDRAFDASYAWEFHHITNQVAKGEMDAGDVRDYLGREAERFSPSAYRMTFVTNHDENSWNGTARERYGDGVRAMAVLCGTAFGMPLIYGGQESDMDKRLRFFEKDTVPWGQYRSMSFYRILNDLHHRNPPLHNGEFGAPAVQLVEEGDVLYYERSDEKTSVRVVINLSADSVEFAPTGLEGYRTTFNRQNLSKTTWEPWGFEVFVKMTP